MKRFAISSEQLKKHQQSIFISLIATLVILSAFLFFIGLEEASPPKAEISENAPLYDVTKALDDKSFWIFKSEQRLSEQEKKQGELMADIEAIREAIKKPEEDLEKSEIAILQHRISLLEEQLNESAKIPPAQNENISQNEAQPFSFNGVPSEHSNNGAIGKQFQSSSIFSETFALASSDEKNSPHHDSYIPAGSYAKAVLLSGVDVSVGVSSQTNPQPVLLRLVHQGSLPNHFVGKMRDCRIIAAASGELSSERAQFRLEKLSCIEPDGQVIETDVDGYISGEDGKNGMRGRLVIRDAELLKRGFLGGLLSGLGKATSQSFNTTSVSPFGSVSTVKGGDIFKQAGAEGAGNAFELMAKYNIQRAEQYQPVIQISAGREVTVVFHSGRAFGENRVKKNKASEPKIESFFGGE